MQRFPERGGASRRRARRRSTTLASRRKNSECAHRPAARASARSSKTRSSSTSTTGQQAAADAAQAEARRQRCRARGAAVAGAEPAGRDRSHQRPLRRRARATEEALGRRASRLARAAAATPAAAAGQRAPQRRRVGARRPAAAAKCPLERGSAELLAQQLVDLRRIGLALARLHRLADQRVERLFLAGAELRDRLSALAASTSSTIFSSAPLSDICLQALAPR